MERNAFLVTVIFDFVLVTKGNTNDSHKHKSHSNCEELKGRVAMKPAYEL